MATTSNTTTDWNVLTEAYADGASDVEIARLLGITLAKFYHFYETNPAFADFVESGRTLAQAWWYSQMRKGLWDKRFNTPLFNFVMKNRYGWADKTELADTTDKDPIDADALKAQVSITMNRLAKTNPELFSGVNLYQSASKKDEND